MKTRQEQRAPGAWSLGGGVRGPGERSTASELGPGSAGGQAGWGMTSLGSSLVREDSEEG